MVIKKEQNHLEITLDNNNKVIFDSEKTTEKDCITILSDIRRNINIDKIFNLPGEYEIKELYFRGYLNSENLIFVFNYKGVNFIYITEDIENNLLNQIFNDWGEIDIALIKNKIGNLSKLQNRLKFKIIVDIDDKNKLKGEKTKEIKINLKKIEAKNYLLV